MAKSFQKGHLKQKVPNLIKPKKVIITNQTNQITGLTWSIKIKKDEGLIQSNCYQRYEYPQWR